MNRPNASKAPEGRRTPRGIFSRSVRIQFIAVFLLGTTGVFAADPLTPILEEPITAEDLAHWAFRPLVQPAPPRVENAAQVRNPIDRFVLARLEAEDLKLMPEADRITQIRRLCFDLTGLPPRPEDIEAFIADSSPRAYAELVDKLLASPAYGERWAQHWLDLARFGESDGFEHDKIRPDAWRYRDWVIDALNEDMPYDRFVRLQIAGDEIEPGNPDAALATGFLLAGPEMPDLNLPEERRHTVLNEMTSTVGSVFLGLTVGCAACHDHKSDPVSQADFYRLRAFFANTFIPERNKQLGHILVETGSAPPVSRLMIRGDFRSPGAEVRPAFLRVVNPGNERAETDAPPPGSSSAGRRARLAEWLTRPDHPLTLRVIANRLWQHHFVKPLVATPSEFGLLGEKPSHPDLLDWLAAELPKRGWSLKEMHRLIVNSATYRQASRPVNDQWRAAVAADPGNTLLSRMNRRRLSGEALRDAMLAAADRINPKRGGPGFRPPLPKEVTVTLLKDQWELSEDPEEYNRRSIYLFARRNLRFPIFDVFDRPDGNASCAMRSASTTAPQSLTLLNSEFSLDCARHLAGRVIAEAGNDPAKQIVFCYRQTLGRAPADDELETGKDFLRDQAAQLAKARRAPGSFALPLPSPGNLDPHESAALTDFCLALLNSNEMLYVD